MTGVLNGVRVLAFTHFAAGPIAAQYLGALGANVIKIESPKRDVNRSAVRAPDASAESTSPYFYATNRNQRAIALDLKSEKGRGVVDRLLRDADVVIENFRPGVMERLGLGYDSLAKTDPKIVYCSFSAHHPDSPARERPGQDLLIQAFSGLASLSGGRDDLPVPVGAYLVDGFTALQGVVGILAALRHRDATGKGQQVRVDMMSTALYMMAQEASYVLNVGAPPVRGRAGLAHVHQAAPYGVYDTRDGPIAISVFGGAQTVRQGAEALGIADRINSDLNDAGLRRNRDTVAEVFAKRIKELTRAEATEQLTSAGFWVAAVRSLPEALTDPDIAASNLVKELTTSDGVIHRVVTEPLRLSETPLETTHPAPLFGEHTMGILAELGYSAEEARSLVAAGAAIRAKR